jgi:hypothetical protein
MHTAGHRAVCVAVMNAQFKGGGLGEAGRAKDRAKTSVASKTGAMLHEKSPFPLGPAQRR